MQYLLYVATINSYFEKTNVFIYWNPNLYKCQILKWLFPRRNWLEQKMRESGKRNSAKNVYKLAQIYIIARRHIYAKGEAKYEWPKRILKLIERNLLQLMGGNPICCAVVRFRIRAFWLDPDPVSKPRSGSPD